ncbi:Ribosomal silencing factor RsfS [Candidatus Kinetoplastibacterium sorsogonicusi]|uniref:Ribosomal silencing factor RsfS n=1 Tax=Candidatus Kinetoplastidibacterium kentomonadis TaxID=1576550 RepID=A0A3S7J9H3_9PROT|nr:ribosome silencing factor [Candidatus Kinetoplastibacterium sorsogonicusi]AWD32322.1 Ribosomal silencing factor RsfS [Candidatus Kinetoplastibacterium sorsogonicusi]
MNIDKNINKLEFTIINALSDIKAQDIKVFDTNRETSVLFDKVIIATSTSNTHTRALAYNTIKQIKKKLNLKSIRVEGEKNGEWIVIDTSYIIIHIMQSKCRSYYNIEELFNTF